MKEQQPGREHTNSLMVGLNLAEREPDGLVLPHGRAISLMTPRDTAEAAKTRTGMPL